MPLRDKDNNRRGGRVGRSSIDPVRRHLRSQAREAESAKGEGTAGDGAVPSIIGTGYLEGRHYTTYIEEVDLLLEGKRYFQALALLRRLRIAIGSYVAAGGRQPTTWCEEQIRAAELGIAYGSINGTSTAAIGMEERI
jgi:hypothetical protein